MLYDYQNLQQANPYYSNIENDPRWMALKKNQKRDNAINTGIGTTFEILSQLFGGPIGGMAGKAIGGAIKNSGKKSYADSFARLQSGNPNPNQINTTGNNGTDFSALSKVLSHLNLNTTSIPAGAAVGADNSINVGADPTLISAPPADAGQGPALDITQSSGNMDWNSGFNGGGDGNSFGGFAMKDGGAIVISNGGVKMKYGEGGAVRLKAPIITHNPNDPRLRAYQDSSNLYNYSVKQLIAQSMVDRKNDALRLGRVLTGTEVVDDGRMLPILTKQQAEQKIKDAENNGQYLSEEQKQGILKGHTVVPTTYHGNSFNAGFNRNYVRSNSGNIAPAIHLGYWDTMVGTNYDNPNYDHSFDPASSGRGDFTPIYAKPTQPYKYEEGEDQVSPLQIMGINSQQVEQNPDLNYRPVPAMPKTQGFSRLKQPGEIGGTQYFDEYGKLREFQQGGGVEVQGGNGNDDIALVDTTTGHDTGVRVAKGEMLVVNKENLALLHKAIQKGDKKGVFDIMQEQVKAKPNVEGTEGFKKGGKGSTTGNDEIQEGATFVDSNGNDFIYKKGKWAHGKNWLFPGEEISDSEQPKVDESYRAYSYKPNLGVMPNPYQAEAYHTGVHKDEKINVPRRTVNTGPVALPEITPSGSFYGPGYGNYDPVGAREMEQPIASPNRMEQTSISVPQMSHAIDNPYGAPAFPAGPTTTNTYNPSGDIQNALGTGYDIYRTITGLRAANEPLPNFTKPGAWVDYGNHLKSLSETGLTAAQMAQLQGNADRTYAYDAANIYNVSNGNAGAVLGNLGRAANSKYANDLNIAALNDSAKLRNLSNYGSFLGNDVNLDRTIFSDNYNNTLRNKTAGAQLASDAISNIKERNLTDQQYGMGSQQWKYMEMLNKKMQSEAEAQAAQAEWIKKNGFASGVPGNYTPGADNSSFDIGGKKYKLTPVE